MNTIEANLIIFDLDGTLIDSKKDIADAVNSTLAAMGQREIPVEHLYSFVGNGVRPLIEKSMIESGNAERLPEAIKHFQDTYIETLLDTTVMFDGIPEVLEHFASLGKKMAVASNKPFRYVDKIIDGLDMRRYFLSVKGGDSYQTSKPEPEMILSIIEEASSSRKESVIVGDSRVDIKAGINSGIRTVGVTYGFREREEIIEAKPDAMIETPIELKKVIV
ncbi:MAG: HAD hydrolase-like protein [Nitrospinota bacterium]|nr:HAD hydrolase-like protein [Nitrospinota bacterium]